MKILNLIAALIVPMHFVHPQTFSAPPSLAVLEQPRPEQPTIGGSITRFTFTRAVVNQEPIDRLTTVNNDIRFVYFFIELKGYTGESIVHRWENNGRVVAEIRHQIGGPRWRTWSGQTIGSTTTGEWKVMVLDAAGHTLIEQTLPRNAPAKSANARVAQ